MVTVDPWLSTLRSLAVEVVTLVLGQVLVGLPSWGCSASGFLGPAVFLVFTMGSPVSGWDCVLPQSAIVTFAFPPFVGFCLLALVWGPLSQAAAVCFGMRWSWWLSLLLTGRSCSFALGSSSLDLDGVGGFHRVPSPLSSFGIWSPFGVNSAFFVTLDRERRFPLEVGSFTM